MNPEPRSILALSLALLAAVLAHASSRPPLWQSETQTPVHSYSVVRVYPHDPRAFTQGLIYLDGFLYEGTGLRGRSAVRKVRLESGEVVQEHRLAMQYFGEGLTHWNDLLVQLTWQTNLAFVYARETFRVDNTFTYTGEGWGLTQDGEQLIMSDGTAVLRFFDPQAFHETGRLTVRDGPRLVRDLNELEFVRGKIFANVWQTNRLAIIDPSTGHLTAWVDLSGLLTARDRVGPIDVLNGIAYDAEGDRLFVTGKFWPKLFHIKIVQAPAASSPP